MGNHYNTLATHVYVYFLAVQLIYNYIVVVYVCQYVSMDGQLLPLSSTYSKYCPNALM